jgi:hypothetical protein
MIQAYLDEGGTDDNATIVVMAGFLASYRSWRKFQGNGVAVHPLGCKIGCQPRARTGRKNPDPELIPVSQLSSGHQLSGTLQLPLANGAV